MVWAPRLHGEPGGPTSITGTARFVLATFYIASLSFQDTPANDGLWDWDVGSGTVFYSPRWKAMLGYGTEDVGSSPEEWFSRVHPEDKDALQGQVAPMLTGERSSFECEHRARARDGSYRWTLCRAMAVPGSGRPAQRMVGSLTDITERKELEGRLRHLALYDSLTGLPNRSLFTDRLGHTLTRTKRGVGGQFCVMFMDLDGFKAVNDTLGHPVGDLLLTQVAGRITANLREKDSAGRFGGDEFGVLVDGVSDPEGVSSTAQRLQDALNQPYDLEGTKVVVGATIGIALSTADYESAEEMIRDADAAMYRAKADRRGSYATFAASMRRTPMRREGARGGAANTMTPCPGAPVPTHVSRPR